MNLKEWEDSMVDEWYISCNGEKENKNDYTLEVLLNDLNKQRFLSIGYFCNDRNTHVLLQRTRGPRTYCLHNDNKNNNEIPLL